MNRRNLFAATPAALMLAGAGMGTAVAAHAAHLDAELIRVCRLFAEAEFTGWYRYVMAPDTVADENAALDMWVHDPDTWRWIAETPATTPEGWQAKALAYVALNRNAFDDAEDRDTSTPVLASLMRDMAAPVRAVIITRLAEQFGPLPDSYTADGKWISAKARAGTAA